MNKRNRLKRYGKSFAILLTTTLAVHFVSVETVTSEAQEELTPEAYQQTLMELTADIRWAGTQEEQETAVQIAERLQEYGLEVWQQKFPFVEQAKGKQNSRESSNVIAVKRANKNPNGDILIVSAHYDSKECTVGANDNASGEAMLLELARVMKDVDSDTEIRFVSFSAEEEGLCGSSCYVDSLPQEEREHIIGDIQIDMIGHYRSSEAMVMTAFGREELVGNMLVEASAQIGEAKWKNGREAASDHASFSFAGIPAVLVQQGPGVDAENHKFIDNNDVVDPEKAVATGRVIESVLRTIASEETASLLPEAKRLTSADNAVPIRPDTPILFGVVKPEVDVKIGAGGTFEKADESEYGYQQEHYLMETKWFDWEPLVTDFVFRKESELFLDRVFIRTAKLGLTEEELGEKLTEAVGEAQTYDGGSKLWGSSLMTENPSLRQYMITEADGEQAIEVISFIHSNVGEDIQSYAFDKPVQEYKDMADKADMALLETIHKVIPEDDPYVKHIISWTDGYSYILGSCTADDMKKSDSFSIRIDKNDFFDKEGTIINEGKFLVTAVHEYGHALTLNAGQIEVSEITDTSHYNEISLYKEDSYMKAFYDKFYADGKQRDFYEYPEDYVSNYAGTAGMFEDIAECFMQFVIGSKPEGESLAAEKIKFFYSYPEMVELRNYIRCNFGYPTEINHNK